MVIPEFPGMSAGVFVIGIIKGIARQGLEEVSRPVGAGQQEIRVPAGVIDAGAGQTFINDALGAAQGVLVGALRGAVAEGEGKAGAPPSFRHGSNSFSGK